VPHAATPALMAERLPPEPPDVAQLSALPQEKQPTALFKWLTDCEAFLAESTADEVSIHQQTLVKNLLDLLSLSTPALGRVLRACQGRCLSLIIEKGDRKPLFDTVSTLLSRISQFRVDKDTRQKQYCSIRKIRSPLTYLVPQSSALEKCWQLGATVSCNWYPKSSRR